MGTRCTAELTPCGRLVFPGDDFCNCSYACGAAMKNSPPEHLAAVEGAGDGKECEGHLVPPYEPVRRPYAIE